MRFTISKLGRLLGFLRPRWGVRGSLFAAFAVIAGMALVISAGAAMVLGHLGGTHGRSERTGYPAARGQPRLSAQSASLASQGPALLASESEEALDERSKKMKETQQVTLEKLGEIIELGADKTVVAALGETMKNIDETIKSLGAAARERLEASRPAREAIRRAAQRAGGLRRRRRARRCWTPRPRSMPSCSPPNLSPDDAAEAARAVDQLGNVDRQRQSGGIADDRRALGQRQRHAGCDREGIQGRASARQIEPRSCCRRTRNDALKDAALKLLALGEGKTGVFKLPPEGTRRQRLRPDSFSKKPASSMSASASACSNSSTACRARPTPRPGRRATRFRSATRVMLALGGLTLIGSVLFVWLYVGRNILRRIGGLQRSMQLLSDGDLESEIYRSHQHDEIAAMANSLEVFRESMIEARALSAEQDKDRIAKAERASRMEARIVEFEATVRAALDNLQHSANSMQSTAQSMSATADQSSALVERGGVRRRGNLGQRADRVLGHRGTVLLDRRNQPPGRRLGANRPQGRR